MYYPRIVGLELDILCRELPAVALEGPRAVGNTESALRRAGTVYRQDDQFQFELVRADPERLTTGTPPVLIDEWQRCPGSWDFVRRAVDADPRGPRFLVTGSASPGDSPAHTGAGRIVTVRMRPMALADRQICPTAISLSDLLSGRRSILEGSPPIGLDGYAEEIVASGFQRCAADRRGPSARSRTVALTRFAAVKWTRWVVPCATWRRWNAGRPPMPPRLQLQRFLRSSVTRRRRARSASQQRRPRWPIARPWRRSG